MRRANKERGERKRKYLKKGWSRQEVRRDKEGGMEGKRRRRKA